MNLARFGLLKTSQGELAPDGIIEPVEITEEEARALPPDAYTVEAADPTVFDRMATRVRDLSSGFIGQSLPESVTLMAARRPPSRTPSSARQRREPNSRPIPPGQPVKYVRHERRTSKDFVDKAKAEQGLLDLDASFLEMEAKELLRLFPSPRDPEKLDQSRFARNVAWHFYQEIAAGRPPAFAKEGCNIRTIYYMVKTITTKTRLFEDSFYGIMTEAFGALVEAGLVSYRDFNIMDDRKPFRFLPDSDFNTSVLLLSEKKAFAGRFSALASKYGVMAQITDGQSTLLMADTMLTEMFEANFDLSKNLTILSFCDFDPVGTSIPFHFVEHLKTLGFHNVNEFTQYGDQEITRQVGMSRGRPVYKKVRQRRPCLDIVNPHELERDVVERIRHTLKSEIQNNPSTADWAFITGGVTGTGRNKEFAISSEQFLPYVDEHLDKKIRPFLERPPEAVGRRANFKFLHKAIREYIGARAERDALAASKPAQ